MMCQMIVNSLAPSSLAASKSSFGRATTKLRKNNVAKPV